MSLNKNILSQAANEARGLAIDAVASCKSGHLGLPLGAAEIGAVLYGHSLRVNPDEPRWINRDRFVLSAGHGSMFVYSWLHMAGFGLDRDDLKAFRTLHSRTPGHPEFREAPGVESTTGPLGQGVGNAVGMATAGKMAADRYNTPEHTIFDYRVVCLAGDGCLQEGVSQEAAAFAGHFGLDNLILIYDDNAVTLDAAAEETQSEDTAKRFEAYGFDVETVDGHDMEAFNDAYWRARDNSNGRPKMLITKTLVGKGIAEVEGTFKAHGEAGASHADEARKKLGLPEEKFHVSEETTNFFEGHRMVLKEAYKQWKETFDAWETANPEKAKELSNGYARTLPNNLLDKIPSQDAEKPVATRASAGKVLNALAAEVPLIVSGSADLHGSTKNYISDAGDFTSTNRSGKNIRFGIREHAMGAIVNGFGYDGLFYASGATFLTFSDYMRASVRLAALSKLPVFHMWTHDSVGVGQDGPTHQPVETVSALRLIPHLDIIRPADGEETAGALFCALERQDGPTGLILSRQNIPSLDSIPAEKRRKGVAHGAYIAVEEKGELETILLATGSELQHAIEAAKTLGDGVRVVSMPCMERFERQDKNYRDEVLPPTCKKRIAIEAGVTDLWWKWVGDEGQVLGIDRFGLSAAGDAVMEEYGITAQRLIETARG